MSEYLTLTIQEAKAEVAFELKRKQKYQKLITDHEFWLENMCEGFTTQEEQQRLVGDIFQMQDWIKAIDERLRMLNALIAEQN